MNILAFMHKSPSAGLWTSHAAERPADDERGDSKMGELKIDRVLVGEALVGEGNELAHIDLIMGQGKPRRNRFLQHAYQSKAG